MQLVKKIMPFAIGGLVGALITTTLLVIFTGRDSGSANSTEQAAGTSHHAEDHAHHGSDPAELGPVVDLTRQSKIQINIKDYAFSRTNIRVAKGTKVTWTNQDTVSHNVMKEHEGGDAAHEAPVAENVRPDVFAGPLLAKGESYSFTFNKAGTYPYHCAPHPYMQGAVVVSA